MLRVKIAISQEIVPVERKRMRDVATAVLEGEGIREASISLAFVDNTTIHRINKQFLDHDEPTDVVTFPLSGAGARVLEGELVIGAEVGQAQATERGHAVDVELALYVIHGLLHLCGFDDTSAGERKNMRARERHYLALLNLPDVADEE